jgi:hypothetical protein
VLPISLKMTICTNCRQITVSRRTVGHRIAAHTPANFDFARKHSLWRLPSLRSEQSIRFSLPKSGTVLRRHTSSAATRCIICRKGTHGHTDLKRRRLATESRPGSFLGRVRGESILILWVGSRSGCRVGRAGLCIWQMMGIDLSYRDESRSAWAKFN